MGWLALAFGISCLAWFYFLHKFTFYAVLISIPINLILLKFSGEYYLLRAVIAGFLIACLWAAQQGYSDRTNEEYVSDSRIPWWANAIKWINFRGD